MRRSKSELSYPITISKLDSPHGQPREQVIGHRDYEVLGQQRYFFAQIATFL